MERVETSVLDYAIKHPRADYKAIISRFGMPEQVAQSCIDEMELSELLSAMRLRKWVFTVILAVSISIVFLWGCVVLYALRNHNVNVSGYFEDEISTVMTE